jgi:hypothetical protein
MSFFMSSSNIQYSSFKKMFHKSSVHAIGFKTAPPQGRTIA